MFPYDLSGKNKYYTLYGRLRGDILCGRLKAGEKLPSKRSLAADLGVSVVTVQTAYDQLLAEGYIYSRPRSGYYVCAVDIQPAEGRRPVPPAEPAMQPTLCTAAPLPNCFRSRRGQSSCARCSPIAASTSSSASLPKATAS